MFFLERVFVADKIFSFTALTMSCHCLLATTVSDEKSPVNLTAGPLYMITQSSLAAFNILPLSLAVESLIMMCQCVDLFEFIILGVC